MHPSDNWSEVIQGKRYSIKTSTLIADDEYWDGHNFEHHGQNCFLYKTPKGNYFRVNMTQWEGAKDTITPLSKDEAMELWDQLSEKAVEYKEAFDKEPVEA